MCFFPCSYLWMEQKVKRVKKILPVTVEVIFTTCTAYCTMFFLVFILHNINRGVRKETQFRPKLEKYIFFSASDIFQRLYSHNWIYYHLDITLLLLASLLTVTLFPTAMNFGHVFITFLLYAAHIRLCSLSIKCVWERASLRVKS